MTSSRKKPYGHDLPPAFSSMWRLCKLGYRYEPGLMAWSFALTLLAARGLPPATYIYLFPYFAIVNPLAEEFFWRGGIYATLRHLFGSWVTAAAVSSVFFGAWHWLVIRLFVAPVTALAATFVIMGIGFALAAVYEHTRRLAYAVILHALAGDAPLLLLLLLLGRG